MLNEMKYISTIPFSGLFNWDVKIILGDNIITSKKHPMKPFSYFTRPANIQKIKIEDEQEYKIIGVRSYGLGAYKNRITKGKYLKMKVYQQAKLNHLFWCKVDTKNGAFGIITQELSDGIASSNMMFAELDLSRINPDYLQLLFRCPKINAYMDSMVTGTTNRKYIRFTDLLNNVNVPVPLLEDQNKLVEEYNKTITKAAQYNADINRISSDLSNKIKALLGYKNDSSDKNSVGRLLTFYPLSKIDRWDCWNNAYDQISSLYPMEKLYKVIRMNSGLFLPKNKQIEGQYPVFGGNGITGSHNTYCFSGERIIIGRVGEYCGNIHIVSGKYWITDNAFKVDKISDIVSWDYLAIALEYMNLNQYRSISAQPSISQSKILNLSIPIPSPTEQATIVDYYITNKNQLAILEKMANEHRQNALKNFETQIFE